MTFDDAEVEALKRIVTEWVGEGFTTPPYEPVVEAILTRLDVDRYPYDQPASSPTERTGDAS